MGDLFQKATFISIFIHILASSANGLQAPVPADLLVVGLAHGLSLVNLTSLAYHYVITNSSHVFDVDVHRTERSTDVYWSDYEEGRIYSAVVQNGAFSKLGVFVEVGLTTVEGIAVDWIGKNLYWVESRNKVIEVASLSNPQWRSVLVANLVSPRSVAVDPTAGLMFWTDVSDKEPLIERCAMDGTDRRRVVRIGESTDGRWPNGITLDHRSSTIYWTDAKSYAIYSADYEGNNVRKLLGSREAIKWPFSITFFNNSLFWADATLSKVSMIPANGSSEAQIVFREMDYVYGTAVIPSNKSQWQIAGDDNPCRDNGGCSHLCLLRSKTERVCRCPFLMTLQADGRTCEVPSAVTVAVVNSDSTFATNEIIVLNQDAKYPPLLPGITVTTQIKVAFDMDIRKCLLYWTDGNDLWENSCGAGRKILIHGRISSVAVDQWVGTVFYVSQENPEKIFAHLEDGEITTAVVLRDGAKVNALICVTSARKIIWVSSLGNATSVQSANLDGTDLRTIYRKDCGVGYECVSDLAVSTDQSFVYWVEYSNNETVMMVAEFVREMDPSVKVLDVLNDSKTCVVSNERRLRCFGKFPESNASSRTTDDVGYAYVKVVSLGPDLGPRPCEVDNGGCEEQCQVGLGGEVHCTQEQTLEPSEQKPQIDSTDVNSDWLDGNEKIEEPVPTCPIICLNGGVCASKGHNGSCECPEGFQGTRCETPACNPVCGNGRCEMDSNGKPVCVCKPGYLGNDCNISVCDGHCQNGDCTPSISGKINCSCWPGWHGDKCQWHIEHHTRVAAVSSCQGKCLNGGICVTVNDEVYCACIGNYSGVRCEVPGETVSCGDTRCDYMFKVLLASLAACLFVCFILTGIVIYLLRGRCCLFRRYKVCDKAFKLRSLGKSSYVVSENGRVGISYGKLGTEPAIKNAATNIHSMGKGIRREDKAVLVQCDGLACEV